LFGPSSGRDTQSSASKRRDIERNQLREINREKSIERNTNNKLKSTKAQAK
jgi:hypothetical protein